MSLIYLNMDTDKFEHDFLVTHCKRLQQKVAELEAELQNTRTQSQWISVDDAEPVEDKWCWFVNNGKVYRGKYYKIFNKMKCGMATLGFTHFAESPTPAPPSPKEQGQ